ncbi:MAG: TonB-dependent receptor [Opitutaceae bacterium]|nr:TonB-dependent receptor [Opitutaceae bacterium]
MNANPSIPRFALPWANCLLPRILAASICFAGPPGTALRAQPVSAAATGIVAGNVSNQATGNLLEGATINLPQLGLSGLTDNTGRFTLTGVPTGTHTMVASYIGLDAVTTEITVRAGERVTRNFDLTTAIYQLDAFTVTGEREGNAAAITAQRNAPNAANVVAIDSYGNLNNMSASELAILLPGVAGDLSDEGNVVGFTVRGMTSGSNTITIDGALMASQGGMSRQTRMHTITGAMFDQLEVTKGHTPDKGADSLGGTLNLKSRSPLSMREKRRVTYNFSARLAPSFTQQIPMRHEHRIHPLLNLAYVEKFSAFGSEEPNLGVAVNLFYSELAVGFFSTTRDFQNTVNDPAYVWNFQTQDNYNNRKQKSVNVKFDYRFSATTKFTLNTIYNDAFERFRLRYLMRAYTGNQNQGQVPNATTSVVMPGYTDRITQYRPVAQAMLDITSQMSSFNNRMRHVDFGGEHSFDRLQIDYNALYSQTHINSGSGEGGVLVNRISNIGWTLDRTDSDLYPRLTQTAGADWSDPASYRPTNIIFNDAHNDHEVKEVRGNLRYRLPTRHTISLKTGARWREEVAEDKSFDRRSVYTGATGLLPADPSIRLFGMEKLGLNLPQWNAHAVSIGRQPVDPSLWRDDLYYREQHKFTDNRGVTETVTAGYLMAQGKIGRTGFLGGVRREKTETESQGWTRARIASTAAQQLADPIGSAERDYANNRRVLEGTYTRSFPSAHFTHDITPNLKARAAWSTSFGRPNMTNLLPNETVNETQQTLTINNPGLRPRTTKNWDLSLDYYFEPVGNFSVGWFRKRISDYIVSGIEVGTVGVGTDNGYNGDYEGFTILTSDNAGLATVQGWEFSYQQQLTFLPGLLRGLGVMANYTVLETYGNFGGGAYRRTGEINGFRPRTGNLSLSWRHRGFSTRITANYTGEFLNTGYNATAISRNQYAVRRVVVNVGAAYQYRPAVTLSVDVGNITNESQTFYRGFSDRISEVRIPGITITFGASGRF